MQQGQEAGPGLAVAPRSRDEHPTPSHQVRLQIGAGNAQHEQDHSVVGQVLPLI